MNSFKNDIIAIDIAKKSLDVRSEHLHFQVANNQDGFKALMQRHKGLSNPMLVCEASGGFERDIIDYCHDNHIVVCLVNPSLIRHYAKSQGVRAKTDAIDSKMILQYAQNNQLKPTPPDRPEQRQLVALLDRRSHLTEMIAREKNRLQNSHISIRDYIRHSLDNDKQDLKQIEKALRDLIANDQELHQKYLILESVKGVGETTAWTILAYMREIGSLKRNELVALAGLAPFNNESGMITSKRSIIGGRAKVRTCLYMAAQTAAIHNPVIKPYVQGLRSRGKPYKCAMVAAMRKILIHLHILIKNYELSLA